MNVTERLAEQRMHDEWVESEAITAAFLAQREAQDDASQQEACPPFPRLRDRASHGFTYGDQDGGAFPPEPVWGEGDVPEPEDCA